MNQMTKSANKNEKFEVVSLYKWELVGLFSGFCKIPLTTNSCGIVVHIQSHQNNRA